MKYRLIEYICCPVDRQSLRLDIAKVDGPEILEGTLSCADGHRYVITKGVPRLFEQQSLSEAGKQTQASFSAKWQRIPNFGHESGSRDVYVSWYLERYGFGDMEGLRKFLADKKKVLDAGTGLGRDASLYGKNTDGDVFAIDLSSSIDLAYSHAGHLPNVHFVQADLTALPFEEGFFDFIASDQVLHHTPNTENSFRYLTNYLAPQGQIAVYVYRKKGPIREFCDDFLRKYYTETSEEECYAFACAITALGKSLSDLNVDFEVLENIPILNIEAGRYNLQRFIYWNIFKCYWNDDLDFETNVMTNFDWYHPRYAHRHTEDEVRQWCTVSGLEIVHFNSIESGISVRASKQGGDF